MRKVKMHLGGMTGFRFAVPVILENVFTVSFGLVFSAILGNISASSMAAAGTGNQVINCILALFYIVTSGAAILTAVLTGKGDRQKTGAIVEQSVLLAPVLSAAAMVIMLLTSEPLLHLLMPGADEAFFQEGLSYYRVVALSFPFLIMSNTFSSILRSAGDSRMPFLCVIAINIAQIAAAVLFVSVLKMRIVGAALSYVFCRMVGALTLGIALFRHRRAFSITLKGVLTPRIEEIKSILKTGAPTVIDGIAVQSAYIFINTILIGLGKNECSVYNVLSTLITFSAISQSIVNVSSTTLTGQKVGAGDIDGARKYLRNILAMGVGVTVVLSMVLIAFPRFFSSLFTPDADVLNESVRLIWATLMFGVPAVMVNAAEPAARVGGMSKYVAVSGVICVWLLRVPLTLLFCYPLNMGVFGVMLANSIACFTRSAVGVIMVYSKKWGRTNV